LFIVVVSLYTQALRNRKALFKCQLKKYFTKDLQNETKL